jgi:hypothetical protein
MLNLVVCKVTARLWKLFHIRLDWNKFEDLKGAGQVEMHAFFHASDWFLKRSSSPKKIWKEQPEN